MWTNIFQSILPTLKYEITVFTMRDLKNKTVTYVPSIISFYLYIYLWLRWVFIAVHGLLIAVASLMAEHGL